MVAAAKMRVEVNRLDKGKEFGVGSVQRMLDNESYLQKKKSTPTIKKSLLVPITSDKGLCGGVNSTIVRFCKVLLKENRNLYKLVVIGDKGTLALQRPYPDILHASINQIATPMNFPTAGSIAHQVSDMANDCDNIVIVYN
jgi:F-type H+-transporting ATPase subunit gamma